MGWVIGVFVLVFLMFRGVVNSFKEMSYHIEKYNEEHKNDNNQK